jgi:hypothetical protein
MTLLPNGDHPAGFDDHGALRVVRTQAGPRERQLVVGDVSVHRTSDDDTLALDLFNDEARPVVVDVWLRDDVGPRPGASAVRVDEAPPTPVADEAALLACADGEGEADACVLLEERRVRVARRAARSFTFTVAP